MSAQDRGRKKFLWIAVLGVLLLAVVARASYRPIAARFVSWRLLAEATRLRGEMKETSAADRASRIGLGIVFFDELPLESAFWQQVAVPLAKSHGGWLKGSYFDREDLLRRLPEKPFTKDALAVAAVIAASILAVHPDLGTAQMPAESGECFGDGLLEWLAPAMLVPATKELLVDLLTSDYVPGAWTFSRTDTSSYLKGELIAALTADRRSKNVYPGDFAAIAAPALAGLTDRHWQAVLRHCDHPREKVRAGSLLLLLQHPNREICLQRARLALADPSEWVRLAAAGILARNADASGGELLLRGFDHARWEVRYWCGESVALLGQIKYAVQLRRHTDSEADAWVKQRFHEWTRGMIHVVPKADWARAEPADLNLDASALKGFEEHVGGRGCVVRFGHMGYFWGDIARRADIASAAKPFYTHFLFKAIDDGRIGSIDDRVSRFEPRLLALNPSLGNKDAEITWRHLANQISCYGSTEKPGAAFDYNDFNMAFFFDTLFLRAFELKYEDLDKEVLHARLTEHLQCQDEPTFFAFNKSDRAGRMAISVRDHARFGLLYLHGGTWGKRNLISPEHVQLATRSALPNSIPRTKGEPAEMIPGQRSIGGQGNQTDHMGSYSFAWWTNGVDRDGRRHWPDAPIDTFAALGHGGMRACVVIPSLDLVVAWNDSKIETREAENEALRLLVSAVKEPSTP